MEINQIQNEKSPGDYSFVNWVLMNPACLDQRPVLKELLTKESCADIFDHDILELFDSTANETSMHKSYDDRSVSTPLHDDLPDVFTPSNSHLTLDEPEVPNFMQNSFVNGLPPLKPLEQISKPKTKSLVKCHVCSREFATRSAKQYHKTKFAAGTMCNVPSEKGRPRYSDEERIARRKATRFASRQKERRNRKQAKALAAAASSMIEEIDNSIERESSLKTMMTI